MKRLMNLLEIVHGWRKKYFAYDSNMHEGNLRGFHLLKTKEFFSIRNIPFPRK